MISYAFMVEPPMTTSLTDENLKNLSAKTCAICGSLHFSATFEFFAVKKQAFFCFCPSPQSRAGIY
jgi:hypothetical protein